MSIYIANEILEIIERELNTAKESVRIITAFCKLDAIRRLAGNVNQTVQDKKLVVRFRLDDIIGGSTDFSILDFCFENGWQVLIRFDLHAKTYIVDNRRGIIGSANATRSGMHIAGKPNLEMAALVDLTKQDLAKIDLLLADAVLVTPELASTMRAELQQQEPHDSGKGVRWSIGIESLFKPKVQTLFSHELPECGDYAIGDYIAFLDMPFTEDSGFARERFRWCNAYLWLLNTLGEHDGELYFGELTALLHSALVEDPKPYRKDVKQLLSNLLTLIVIWEMPEIIVDRPNRSQRIRLRV